MWMQPDRVYRYRDLSLEILRCNLNLETNTTAYQIAKDSLEDKQPLLYDSQL